MGNYMDNKEWSTWKRRLTIAKKKGAQEVIEVCEAFFRREADDHVCLPDDWHRFNIALEDARLEQRRATNTMSW